MKPRKLKLEVESLEGRCLPAAPVLSPITAAPALVSAPQSLTTVPDQPMTAGYSIPLARDYSWVSGLRINHNETLVRGPKVRRRRSR